MSQRDVFICHASDDKADYARPLRRALDRRGVSCWVDEAVLRPGDSLVAGINQGLSQSACVVLVITDRFLGRSWPELEMAAATQLMLAGRVRVVPVLDVSRDVILDRYPLASDLIGLSWADDGEAVGAELAATFGRRADTDWVYTFDKTHIGPIWTRLTPSLENASSAHTVTMRWGPWLYRTTVPAHDGSTSMTHFKERADELPLAIEVSPAAIITVGSGLPPDEQTVDINEGWTRPSGWAPTQADRVKARESIDASSLRVDWHVRLRAEYCASRQGVSPGVQSGDDPLPPQWLQRRARELGISELLGFDS